MKKFSALIILTLMVLFPAAPAFSSRVVTVPFSESFDSDFTDLDWLTNGATETFLPSGGWSGGAKRITPPTTTHGGNGGYAAVGSFNFTSGVTSLHIRVLMKFGTSYITTSLAGAGNEQNKIIIADGTATRAMVSLTHWSDPSKDFSFGPCDNAVCRYENGQGSASEGGDWWPTSANTFKLSDYLGQWIAVEWAIDCSTGTNRLYIWSTDGVIDGLYKEYQVATGGVYNTIQVIGGFYNGYNSSDANTYIEFDELQVSTSYIGPPEGFTTGGESIPPVKPVGYGTIKIFESGSTLLIQ